MKPYKIAIFFSGIERTLAGSAFNMRVDECRSAAYALKAYAGMEYCKFNETNLRDVPVDEFFDNIAEIKKQYKIYKQGDSGLAVIATVGADVTKYEDKNVSNVKSNSSIENMIEGLDIPINIIDE